jgi:preprotein translocase subunit SecG
VQLALSIALIIISTLLIVLVLLHRGRGGGLSDMFGGGVSSSVGGSSVAERNLNRITIALTVIWVVLIVALSLYLKAQG